jgi:inner membrane protein
VVLTFITVFVVENRKRTPIHWVQYLLIGFAIMVFYTLLLSFSEYLTFCWSYLIASAMTIGLITAYMAGILKVHKTAYLVGAILAFLYAFIYVLLSLETMSLLVGSIGLFVILAVIMFASRKINWQGNDKQ